MSFIPPVRPQLVSGREGFRIGADEAANQFGSREVAEAQQADALVGGATLPRRAVGAPQRVLAKQVLAN